MNRVILAALAALALSTSAFATVELQLSSGAATSGVVVGAGGLVTFSGAVGGWTINLTDGLSGGPATPVMDLSSIDAVAAAGAAPLTILLTDTGFTSGGGGFVLQGSGHLITGTGTSTYSAYYSNANTAFATTSLIGTLGPFSGAYAVSQGFAAAATPLYSLTEKLVLTSTSSDTRWSTDSSIAPVPEPASVTLLGGFLLASATFLRKKLRKA